MRWGAKLGLRRLQKTNFIANRPCPDGWAGRHAGRSDGHARPAASSGHDQRQRGRHADAGHPQMLAVCPAPRRRGQSRIKAHAGMRCGSRPAPRPSTDCNIYLTGHDPTRQILERKRAGTLRRGTGSGRCYSQFSGVGKSTVADTPLRTKSQEPALGGPSNTPGSSFP